MPRRDGTGPCGAGQRMGYGKGFRLGQNYGCKNKMIDYSLQDEKEALQRRLEELEQLIEEK